MLGQKKIALMTWYKWKNYGTVLQAGALTKKIKDLGYDVKVISYLPRKQPVIKPKQSLRLLLKNIFFAIKKRIKGNTIYISKEKEVLFETYLDEHFEMTTNCTSYAELYQLNEQFDAFVCGSDQIWSPIAFEDKYFLPFVENESELVAYAPSFGVSKIEDSRIKEKIVKLVSRFKHLSVRESYGAKIIEQLVGRKAEVVLDPTLLMDKTEWDQFIAVENIQKLEEEKYIICYFLGDYTKYIKIIHALSKRLKIPFYIIPLTKKCKNKKYSVPFEVGPNEFVSLMRNATYVCTDSFHGVAFSIIYNIPFLTFKRFKDSDTQNQNSRIYSLLKLLALEDRLIETKKLNKKKEVAYCDFLKTNQLLEGLRRTSKRYLESALIEASNSNKEVCKKYKITDLCCGCGTCTTVCAKGAISIRVNEEGFYHYAIDETKCVKCGQCKTVCPMVDIVAPSLKNAKALYAVKSTSKAILETSSSGGIGYELGKRLLQLGYTVFGCSYDSDSNTAKHTMINPNEPEKLKLLQGSKYIQSMTETALTQIRSIAKEQKIAFFGTPCQVAGVDKLLLKQGVRENAILIDLICHGVPSYHLFNKYLETICQKKCISLHPKVAFRIKKKKWQKRYIKIYDETKAYISSERKDHFYAFFRRGLCDMSTCYDCPYRESSSADIRLGDYWGEKYRKSKLGVSMVIAKTKEGQELLGQLEEEKLICSENCDLDDYWKIQYPYNQLKPLWRETLIEDLKNDSKSLCLLRKEYCRNYDIFEKMQRIFMGMKRFFKK